MKKSSPSFWLDRPTLVTGGTGLLGSWLVEQLVQAGASVVCIVRDRVPQSKLLQSSAMSKVTLVDGDVTDQEGLERALGEYEIDTVFHLAAQTIVGVANRNPISTYESNIQGTWSLLEACRRSPCVKQIVTASSDKAYGTHSTLPYTEDTPLKGEHPYDVSKTCADLLAQSYAQTFGLPVTVSRCGNFYGGGDLNWNRIVPGTIRSVIRGQRPIIRSDGTFSRDYLYVEDGAAAYMKLAEGLAKRTVKPGEAFNFSLEQPLSVLALVKTILKVMKSDVKPIVENTATNEIHDQFLSAKKAKKVLQWKPLFSLEEGLEKTIAWYEQFFLTKT